MRAYRFSWISCSVLLLALLSACGGGGGGGNGDNSSKPVSSAQALIADAGRNQNIKTGQRVRLDGSNSKGLAGKTINYQWSFTSKPTGSRAALSDKQSAAPTFSADVHGKYQIRLVVLSNGDRSKPAQVTVTSTPKGANSAPVAAAGMDRCVATGAKVALNGGNSADADGNGLNYRWQFDSRPDGSSAKLAAAGTVTPTFTASDSGDYVVTLTVTDGNGGSDADQVTVSAGKNASPQADAGPDQNVRLNASVTLDGTKTQDAEGNAIRYQWRFVSQPAASRARLSAADTVSPMFKADVAGTYVVELAASDGQHDNKVSDCASDRVIVTASKGNSAPTANAGADQNVGVAANVQLDGSNSADANGDDLTYRWSFVSQPKGSQATLSNTDGAKPTFNAQMAGTYVVQLVVNDSKLDSQPDRVQVVAAQNNSAPVANAGEDQPVPVGNEVTLDGSASSDANKDALSYQWQLVSRPNNSKAQLKNADGKKPTFVPDQIGAYVVGLVVNDGKLDSQADQVAIEAGPTLAFYADRRTLPGGQKGAIAVPNFQIYSKTIPSGAGQTLLTLFRLQAIGRTYTITDVTQSVLGQSPKDKIGLAYDNLPNNTTIKAGTNRDFGTYADVPDAAGIYLVSFNFNLKQTNTPFQIQYCLDVGKNDLSCDNYVPKLGEK